MTENECRNRLEDGEDPLELSIEKWEHLVQRISKNGIQNLSYSDYNARSCALCHIFTYNYNINVIADCEECPVYKSTSQVNCEDTPYYVFTDAILRKNKIEALEYAREELEFLKSLRT